MFLFAASKDGALNAPLRLAAYKTEGRYAMAERDPMDDLWSMINNVVNLEAGKDVFVLLPGWQDDDTILKAATVADWLGIEIRCYHP